jgi:hypothetical protein
MRLILALAAGVLGYCYYLGQSARKTKGSVREDLRRWEGEGGNLPAAARHSPRRVAHTSDRDFPLRH